jgi:hypothetical protein
VTETAVWVGADGTRYTYKVFPVNAEWNDVPGNYIFAKRATLGGWIPLYIGETGSLQDRPLSPEHEKWGCAADRGMTHIHAHTSNPVRSVRTDEESNLRRRYSPPCNQQARRQGLSGLVPSRHLDG